MPIWINRKNQKRIIINGKEIYRVFIGNKFIYGKRQINFDLNVSSIDIPSSIGYHKEMSIPSGTFYTFWNDGVYLKDNDDYNPIISYDFQSYVIPPPTFRAYSSNGYDWTLNFIGWYTNSTSGTRITDENGKITQEGEAFLNNTNNYSWNSSGTMNPLKLYAHWAYNFKVRVRFTGIPEQNLQGYKSELYYYYNNNRYKNGESVDIWIPYGAILSTAINKIYNCTFEPTHSKQWGTYTILEPIGYSYSKNPNNLSELININSLNVYGPIEIYPTFACTTFYWDETGKYFNGVYVKKWEGYVYPVSIITIKSWLDSCSSYTGWEENNISTALYLNTSRGFYIYNP